MRYSYPIIIGAGLLSACSMSDGGKGDEAGDTTGYDYVDADDDGYSSVDEGGWDTGDSGRDLTGDSGPGDSEPVDTASEFDVCDYASDETQTLYMSADDSNSKAQPAYVRGLLAAGARWSSVPPYLRSYEFLNYYSFDYDPAEAGSVRIEPQAMTSTEEADAYELLVAVVGPAEAPEDRPPASFTFSLDTSGSMDGDGMACEKSTMSAVAGSLIAGDVVSIVKWSDSTSVPLDSYTVSGPDDATLLAAIDALDSGGSTNLSQGLNKAYEIAAANYSEGALNRVFLISDGGANTGLTDEELIGDYAEDREAEGIYMMGVGCMGSGGYDDHLMDRVTDLGKGAYLYMDSSLEAVRQFSDERFVENTQIAAYDVRLEMDLPPGFVIDRFRGEQISTDPAEVRPQNLAPDDQMLYDMTLVDCAPETHDGSEIFTFRVTWSDLSEDHVEETSITLAELTSGAHPQLTKAHAILAYMDGMMAARATGGDEGRLAIEEAAATVEDADTTLGGDDELDEILDLLALYEDAL